MLFGRIRPNRHQPFGPCAVCGNAVYSKRTLRCTETPYHDSFGYIECDPILQEMIAVRKFLGRIVPLLMDVMGVDRDDVHCLLEPDAMAEIWPQTPWCDEHIKSYRDEVEYFAFLARGRKSFKKREKSLRYRARKQAKKLAIVDDI